MNENDVYKNYLFDLGPIIMERALEARTEKRATSNTTSEKDYAAGRLMAFNEVISIMQQQAEGLGIPLKDLRLDGIEPDRDLL